MLGFSAILGKAHAHALFLQHSVLNFASFTTKLTLSSKTAQQIPHWKGVVNSEEQQSSLGGVMHGRY